VSPEGIVRSCEFGRKYLHYYRSLGEKWDSEDVYKCLRKISYFV